MNSKLYFYLRKHSKLLIVFLQFIIFQGLIYGQGKTAQTSESAYYYPEIKELKSRNVIFSQYQQEIEKTNMAQAAGKPYAVNFYVYTCSAEDTLFTVSSRCCILYDTLVTLNNIEDTESSLEGIKLYLPTSSGLFIPLENDSAVNLLLRKEKEVELNSLQLPVYTVAGKKYYFLQGQRFSQSVRAFFLTPGMVLPLDKAVLTSSFGMRISPISGQWKFHEGIDLASPLGSNIYCCKNGTVEKVIYNDSVYGNYCIVRHSDGLTSLYAHMNEVFVTKGDVVKAGKVLGKVGLTGMTTGPHLHFEIRENGKSKDPESFYQ